MTFIHVAATQFMEQQTIETIDTEVHGLVEQKLLSGIDAVREIIALRSRDDPHQLGIYLLRDSDGRRLAGNIALWPMTPPHPDGAYRLVMQDGDDRARVREKLIMARIAELGEGYELLVGRDIEEKRHVQHLIRNAIVLGVGMMLFLGIIGGFAMSRWTVGRLEQVNRTTAAIMAGNFARRIELDGGGDEFDELAQNLNAMLERIERLIAGMREVSDNIAHDLRTPLSRMRSRIEVALLRDIGPDDARDLLEATMHDADALIATFNALLSIARAESGARQSEWERVDLGALVQDVAELYEPLAEEKGMTVEMDLPTGIEVAANRQLLAQAVANVIDNAIKYTQDGGRIRLTVAADPQPLIRVADNGPGIPPDLRDKALERFVRLQPDRSTAGNGLGLSLVSAVARLHEAKLELGDAEPGLMVTLAFRAPPPEAAHDRSARGHEAD